MAASTCPGCSTHLPSKPERRSSVGHPSVAVDVADLQVRAVDRLLVVGAGSHQDPHQDVVVGVALGVAGRLLPHHERAHVDAGHEVGRAEDDRLDARAGGGDRVDVDQPERVLDLRLDPEPPDLEAVGLLDLGQQGVERDDLLGVCTFGSMMQSRFAPAPSTTSMTSRYVHSVVKSLTRTVRTLSP